MTTQSNSEENMKALSNQVATSNEASGFICDVGYSMGHYFKTRNDCPVCKKHGNMIVEPGWIGSRWLHANKECRGYYEVDDGGLAWKRQVTPEVYDLIVKECEQALERDVRAKDATGRKCGTCGTTRGIGYYGVDEFHCFCNPCHRKWLRSPEYKEWLANR